MARPIRIQHPETIYIVTNDFLNYRKPKINDDICSKFNQIILRISKHYELHILAIHLDKTGYKLLFESKRGALSAPMQQLNSEFAQYLNKSLKEKGPVFCGRYKSLVVDAKNKFEDVIIWFANLGKKSFGNKIKNLEGINSLLLPYNKKSEVISHNRLFYLLFKQALKGPYKLKQFIMENKKISTTLEAMTSKQTFIADEEYIKNFKKLHDKR